MSEPTFAAIHRRFFELIAQPEPLQRAAEARAPRDAEATPLSGWISADDEAHAAARLGIYAHMYFARLRDSLREDYETCVTLLGDEAFARLAARYLVAHPSDHPSLRHHGRHFAEFLRKQGALRTDLAEVAELEWARIEVFDAPHAEPLRLAELEGLDARDWPELSLQLIPASRLLDRDHAVEETWRACAQRELPPPPRRAPGTTLIWRRGLMSRHRPLPTDEARALRLLERPARFADLCAVLGHGRDAGAAAARAFELLRQWLVDELLMRPRR